MNVCISSLRHPLDTWTPKHKDLSDSSTAGTTASVCIMAKDRMFVAHVGDSKVVVGTRSKTHPATLEALILTEDHHPTIKSERERIQASGGGITVTKRGTTRVLWHRANGVSIPMINLSRSLGDLWSYDIRYDKYHVSPVPDVLEYAFKRGRDIFMIMASDGLWNVMSPQRAVNFVNSVRQNELKNTESDLGCSKVADTLLEEALHEWHKRRQAADNITIMIVYFFEIEESPTAQATGSTQKHHSYYRPSAVALSDIRRYQKPTKPNVKVTTLAQDIQLARRICGYNNN